MLKGRHPRSGGNPRVIAQVMQAQSQWCTMLTVKNGPRLLNCSVVAASRAEREPSTVPPPMLLCLPPLSVCWIDSKGGG